MRALRFLHIATVIATLGTQACTLVPTAAGDSQTYSEPASMGDARAYAQVSAGFVHTCALDLDGAAWCWGNNDYSQLGHPTGAACGGRPCSTAPVEVRGGLRFTALATGWVHNCGIATDQRTYCWGGGAVEKQGYLGDGALRQSADPVEVASDSTFASVTLGDSHTCALTHGGSAFCWGENGWGQVGDGTRADRATPVAVATELRFRKLSAGAYHTCGITLANEAQCWGDNRWGQLGAGEVAYNVVSASQSVPSAAGVGMAFDDIVAGWEHTCAIATNAASYCWGRNENARQLGDDSEVTHRGEPGPVAGSHNFVVLTAGALATCGQLATLETFCWGANYYGGLGNGSVDRDGVGKPIRTLGGPFTQVAIGQAHACGIDTDRRLWCWGDSSAGQF